MCSQPVEVILHATVLLESQTLESKQIFVEAIRPLLCVGATGTLSVSEAVPSDGN